MNRIAICDFCGSKITIVIRMSANRFDDMYVVCKTCGKKADINIEYDNERTSEFD